jgi:hypothetical protein
MLSSLCAGVHWERPDVRADAAGQGQRRTAPGVLDKEQGPEAQADLSFPERVVPPEGL